MTARGSTLKGLPPPLLSLIPQLSDIFASDGPGAVVAIVGPEGRPSTWTRGVEDCQQRARLGPETVFAVGSVAKQVTGALIALLEARGAVSRSDALSDPSPIFRRGPLV